MATVHDVQAVFRITPARLKALIQSFPDDLLGRAPALNEWSPLEVLRHFIFAERAFTARTRAALSGENSPAISSSPDDPENAAVSPLELVACFESMRAETLAILDHIKDEHLGIEIHHPRMGLMTLHNMLNYWGGHDLMHLIQIEQAVMQPFIPDSGPWYVNFAKHIPNSDAT